MEHVRTILVGALALAILVGVVWLISTYGNLWWFIAIALTAAAYCMGMAARAAWALRDQ